MVAAAHLRISAGADEDQLQKDVSGLVSGGRWQICNDGKGLERSFKFKGFKATWDFMNEVAAECKKQKHHPEWTNIYNQTRIIWTTHNPEGLSALDTMMAAFCDKAARSHGELEVSRTTADKVAWTEAARECCSTPIKA